MTFLPFVTCQEHTRGYHLPPSHIYLQFSTLVHVLTALFSFEALLDISRLLQLPPNQLSHGTKELLSWPIPH